MVGRMDEKPWGRMEEDGVEPLIILQKMQAAEAIVLIVCSVLCRGCVKGIRSQV